MSVFLKSTILIIAAIFLGACATASEQILPEITTTKSIHTHSNKEALLVWRTGYIVPADESSSYFGSISSNALGALVNVIGAEIVANKNHHPDPRNLYQFGEYRQAVFIRSLYKTLVKQHVFRSVKIVSSIKSLKPSQVGMIVDFTSTKVANESKSHQVTLDVHFTLKTKDKTFKRILFVQSPTKLKIKTNMPFKQQQIAAATELLNDIMSSIKIWMTNH